MRRLTLLLLVTASSVAFSETIHLTASAQGKVIGGGTAMRTISPDKTAMTQVRLDLMQGGVPITIDGMTRYDAKCRPVNAHINIKQGGQTAVFAVTYYNGGVKVRVAVQGQSKPVDKNIPWASKLDVADTTNRWFISFQPKPGETVSYQGFDTLKGRWHDIKITFLGKSSVTIDKRKVSANLLRRQADGKISTEYLDEKGMPLLIDDGQMKLERKF